MHRTATVLALATVGLAQDYIQVEQQAARSYKFLKSSNFEMYQKQPNVSFNATGGLVGDEFQYGCSFLVDLDFYDLTPLKIWGPRYVEQVDPLTGSTLRLSFCQDLPEALYCDLNDPTMVTLVDYAKQCNKLSGPNPTSDADLQEIFQGDKDLGIRIQYKNGDPKYNFTVDILCSEQEYEYNNYTFNINGDKIDINVNFSSKVGCKYDQLSQIWKFLENNKWIMFAVFTILGFTLCFAGRAMVKVTLCFLGIIISAFIIIFIFYSTFLKKDSEQWLVWAVLGGAILVGLLFGFILQKYAKIGAFVLAGWGGFTLGLILYNTVVYKLIGSSATGYWCFNLGMALIMGVLAYFLYDHVIIQATALFGSFLAVYGIGLVAGHYPNPFIIQEMIKHNTFTEIDPLYYAYLGGNLVLYILGCVVQYRHKKRYPESDYEDKMAMRRHRRR